MEIQTAVVNLSALAHEGRLSIFRLLVTAGPEGIAAGDIARHVASPPSTTTANLHILAQAGLVTSRRDGRSIIYTACYAVMRDLLAYLMEDCCSGSPEICAPLAAIASQCCVAEGACT
ncbi:MAG: helix-turn-helix transcriptional regulator [Phenylobacterium sp.]|uniref:ArsR/SmtB family transcription factor n=1 Tax=Phenylobacterium sp. TaxID=1871053 RepID=UPI001A3C9F72|nr:helix-turn-helix transcriptional regulator [Phenylobacterium sp.]MBL8552883.1 helix-turn-helix transcriptional regulator [Phenylobacterium sp.]